MGLLSPVINSLFGKLAKSLVKYVTGTVGFLAINANLGEHALSIEQTEAIAVAISLLIVEFTIDLLKAKVTKGFFAKLITKFL